VTAFGDKSPPEDAFLNGSGSVESSHSAVERKVKPFACHHERGMRVDHHRHGLFR